MKTKPYQKFIIVNVEIKTRADQWQGRTKRFLKQYFTEACRERFNTDKVKVKI